jgi:2-keto-4-pentenoate hydratase
LCSRRLALAGLARPDRIEAAIRIGGQEMCRGSAAGVLEGPLSALDVLRGLLADDPRGLQPGDYIATGAMCRSVLLPPGALPVVVRPRAVRTAVNLFHG